ISLLKNDPNLDDPANLAARRVLEERLRGREDWSKVS
ncbi:MAG: hypothetical protein RL090_1332, partial [Bacteroidota bacterium]